MEEELKSEFDEEEEKEIEEEKDNNIINIPNWDLEPPFDTVDRGEL